MYSVEGRRALFSSSTPVHMSEEYLNGPLVSSEKSKYTQASSPVFPPAPILMTFQTDYLVPQLSWGFSQNMYHLSIIRMLYCSHILFSYLQWDTTLIF